MADMDTAKYKASEELMMSDNRLRINRLTDKEFANEWDRVTRAICRKCGFKRKDM